MAEGSEEEVRSLRKVKVEGFAVFFLVLPKVLLFFWKVLLFFFVLPKVLLFFLEGFAVFFGPFCVGFMVLPGVGMRGRGVLRGVVLWRRRLRVGLKDKVLASKRDLLVFLLCSSGRFWMRNKEGLLSSTADFGESMQFIYDLFQHSFNIPFEPPFEPQRGYSSMTSFWASISLTHKDFSALAGGMLKEAELFEFVQGRWSCHSACQRLMSALDEECGMH